MKKLMLLAAMLAMVLAVAAPAMAQTTTTNQQTGNEANLNVQGGGDVNVEDVSYTECFAIVSQGGDVAAALAVNQSATATNNQEVTQYADDAADVAQYCVDIIDSFNVTKLFVGRLGIL